MSKVSSTGRPGRRAGSDPRPTPAGRKQQGTEALAAAFPSNAAKSTEFGRAAQKPAKGQSAKASDAVTGSTLTEKNSSAKLGSGKPVLGADPNRLPLDRARADASGQVLTTNQGVPVADNQNSLKAGLRGPALLEDFILREKITHFDHERIPERIVHARGSAAHGYFECYAPLTKHTRASIFAGKGKRTPLFVRFSTVVGERGSADTVRERVLSMIANVDAELVRSVAQGLDMPVPKAMPKAIAKTAKPEVTVSPALSLFSLPGDGNLATRHVALLVADGVEGKSLHLVFQGLQKLGAVVRYVALGSVR